MSTVARRLVITADDLGVDAATNAAIADLLREGRISASTLITVAPAAEDAVARVRAAGGPTPRLHVTLTSARELAPWRPLATGVDSLTDGEGRLRVDAARVEREASTAHVLAEMAAQLGWMRSRGLPVAGLDSHSGSLYDLRGGSLARAAVDFCADRGLSFRLPRRLHRALLLTVRGLGSRHRRAIARADEVGVRVPQLVATSWWPGALITGYGQLRAQLLRQLRCLPAGTSELVLHPAPLEAVASLPAGEARKRVWELRLLRDPVFWNELRRERLEVVPAW